MLAFHKKSAIFMAITELSCIFANMNEKDRDIIERLINRDKTVIDDFIEMCSYAIDDFIAHYHENCKDKKSLKRELAYELYDYILRKDILVKFKGKNTKGKDCSLKTYLGSIARFRLPRVGIVDPLITKTKEKRKEKKDKEEDIIKEFDNEPENFQVFDTTPIPNEFRDEDEAFEADFFYARIDDEEEDDDDSNVMEGNGEDSDGEEDIVIDFDDFEESFIDNTTNSTIDLVRQTLGQLPPKEAYILRKQFYEGYEAKELAKELGHTVNVIYNLKSQAMRDFKTIYLKLKNELL